MVKTLKTWLRKRVSAERKTRCCGCGNCCELFGGHLQASPADIALWRRLGRDDLLQRVNRLGWIWVDPQTKQPENRCPFLSRTGPDSAHCTIHEIKPAICRSYPTLAHGHRCLRGVFLNLYILVTGNIPSEHTFIVDKLIDLV